MTIFGPLVGPITIENALIATLREWANEYAAEIERYEKLPKHTIGRPPVPEAFRGGLDWLSTKEDWLVEVKVICNPVGEPEWLSERYLQSFQVEVGVAVKSEEGTDPEAIARRNAGLWAAACMGAIMQHETLGLGAEVLQKTDLTGAPRVEFLDAEQRKFAVGITTYLVHVQLLEPKAGPKVKQTPIEETYPEPAEIKKETVTITAEPVSEEIH